MKPVLGGRRLRIAVLCPHFAPDTAPTGDVSTAIVHELAALGHELHVVTSLPWYRDHAIVPGWEGRVVRREATSWGSITRVHPFATKDKRDLLGRARGFVGFSALAGLNAMRGGRVDAVLAMSPPFTMGLTGWLVHLLRRGPLVYNIQDVFPDAAIATGAITNPTVIAVARWVERLSYRRSAVVTVLSEEMRANVAAKVPERRRRDVVVIPNFVDTEAILPLDRLTALRTELGIGDEPVVMYAGNVGFSQSLEMVVDAARLVPEATFLINGGGAARVALERRAEGVPNVRFGDYQPRERLAEVLATGDIHLVPLRSGLGTVSVPSKTYSVLAAGRPVVAAIDADTEVPRILAASGAGVAVAPDDLDALVRALRELLADPLTCERMGVAGRAWVEAEASPRAAASAYEQVFRRVAGRPG
ncbi:MAG: putative glycosyltransferase [Ilumatobacteraceae bacterium]|nr:putative glycosyltransferase [Ilumatobacteraceae bacterium]